MKTPPSVPDASDASALPRSAPEEQGVESGAILNLIRGARERSLELHSLMILRHGHVIAEGWWEPYHREGIQLLYSLSKSFTASAIGILSAEGRLDLEARVTSFFPDKLPATVSPHLASMSVRHLLTMATGHADDTIDRVMSTAPGDWVRGFLAIPPEYAPGARFTYNNGATHVLAAIVEQVTGGGLVEFLRPRLLDPLGIRDARWQVAPNGIEFGFSGLHLTTESIARFGQLYLQRGRWNDAQLLSSDWVEQASGTQVSNAGEQNPDWQQGYGFQFWRSRHGYRGDGAFGQLCLVLPDQDAVVVVTGATEDMQALIDVVWAQLLPAMHSVPLRRSAGHGDLVDALRTLEIEAVQGDARPSASAGIDAAFGARMQEPFDVGFAPFEAVSLDHEGGRWVIVVESHGRVHRVLSSHGGWHPNYFDDVEASRRVIFASGVWTAPDVFTTELLYAETPHRLRIDWRPGADAQRVKMSWNVVPIGPWTG